MLSRKIGKIVRGTATPFQIAAACVLSASLGFMPGVMQAPGLILSLLFLLVILNANLAVAAIVGVVAKLLALALTPVAFSVGHWLLDGPSRPLFEWMINAPVLAWFGFDYYTTTGGLVLGLFFGGLTGWACVRAVTGFRRKVAAFEQGSERFKKYAAKGWVKVLTWLFFGGGQKKLTREQLLARKVGNPIRPLGVIFVAVVTVFLVLLSFFAQGPILTSLVQSSLARVNGATVDLKRAELDLANNRLTLTDLALADPNALDHDLVRAAQVEADLSGMSLLRKRARIDHVLINDARYEVPRRTPGHLVGPPPRPAVQKKPVQPGTKTLDDYLREAKVWKERLAQVRRWLKKISPKQQPQGPTATPAQKKESLRQRLEREVRELGYTHVRATHLIEKSPTLSIARLDAEKVRVPQLPGETLDFHAWNLSTQPSLLADPPRVQIQSSRKTLDFDFAAASLASGGQTTNRLAFDYRGLPADWIAGRLVSSGTKPLEGGTVDVSANGQWHAAAEFTVDLPIEVTLHNTTIRLPGGKSAHVKQLQFPIEIRGPLDNPGIRVDGRQLATALAKAGASSLVRQAESTAGKKLQEKLKGKLPPAATGLLNGLLPGGKPPNN